MWPKIQIHSNVTSGPDASVLICCQAYLFHRFLYVTRDVFRSAAEEKVSRDRVKRIIIHTKMSLVFPLSWSKSDNKFLHFTVRHFYTKNHLYPMIIWSKRTHCHSVGRHLIAGKDIFPGFWNVSRFKWALHKQAIAQIVEYEAQTLKVKWRSSRVASRSCHPRDFKSPKKYYGTMQAMLQLPVRTATFGSKTRAPQIHFNG